MRYCRIALILLIHFSVAKAHDRVTQLYDIPRFDNIVVDGLAGDWGDNGFQVNAFSLMGSGWRPVNDFDVQMRLGWDNKGLLVLLTVNDQTGVEHEQTFSLYRGDCVELFFADRRGGTELIGFTISPGLDPRFPEPRMSFNDRRQDGELKKTGPSVEYAVARRQDGYLMEIRLPWEQLGVKPEVGVECGLNVYVNDVDVRQDLMLQGEQAAARWYPEILSILNTTALHSLRLSESASDPVDVAAWMAYASDRPGNVRIQLAAPASYAEQTAVLKVQNKILSKGRFEMLGGRAIATLFVPSTQMSSRPDDKVTSIFVGEQQVGTLDQVLIPESTSCLLFEEKLTPAGAMIPRTMEMLADSTPEEPRQIKIFLYGQSITAQCWWWTMARELRERFPSADLCVINRAIGGFAMPSLLRTAEADLFPEYPDLIILRAYEMHNGSLEQMVRNIRSRTTSEIILMNHHISSHKYRLADNRAVREVATKYGCEYVEISDQWGQYLADNNLSPEKLRSDGVHLNAAGCELMAQLVSRHFQFHPEIENPWSNTIETIVPKFSRKGKYKFTFEGNRIDIVAGALPDGTIRGSAEILINGKPPSKIPELYAFTRVVSEHPGYWSIPYIRPVASESLRVEEIWSCRVVDVHAGTDGERDESFFKFEVEGSVTGRDGIGDNRERFVSNSGRVVIEPESWGLKPSPGLAGVVFTWRSVLCGLDLYHGDREQGEVSTVAQGLKPGRHTLEISCNGEVPIKAIRIHRPPLWRESGEISVQ